MKQIVWKKIKAYDGYQVSNTGEVRSIDRFIIQRMRPAFQGTFKRFCKGTIVKPVFSERGYARVMLTKGKRELVHRLVAKEFIPNPHNKPHVNHLDNNPSNNLVSNLEWVTQSENVLYCYSQGRQSKNKSHGETHHSSKLSDKDVLRIRELKGKFSYRKLGQKFGVNHSSIKNIILRRTWKHL
jgi:hypothetical protein